MPGNGASDAVWEAWADFQEFEAAAVGLASRPAGPGDGAAVQALAGLLARPGLRRLLGDRFPLAEEFVAALGSRSVSG